MNPLLEQFLSESRDLLENTGKNLMQLEDAPDDQGIINELFRSVHTLKGNSGLFAFPEMTRVLHAGEDLMGMVRGGHATYSRELADRLLEAMDFVGLLCGEIESTERIDASRSAEAQHIAEGLRRLMPNLIPSEIAAKVFGLNDASLTIANALVLPIDYLSSGLPFASIPEAVRMAAFRQCQRGDSLHWVAYKPERECFFHGDDPLNSARQTPGLVWGRVLPSEPLPPLSELDTYSCALGFHLFTTAAHEELAEYYRHIPDQVEITVVDPLWLVIPQGDLDGPAIEFGVLADLLRLLKEGDRTALKQRAQTLLGGSTAELWLSSSLRWLICLLDIDRNGMPHDSSLLRLLIQSIASGTPPDWTGSSPADSSAAEIADVIADGYMDANPPRPLSENDQIALDQILAAQRQVLLLDDRPAWHVGRIKSVAMVLTNIFQAVGDTSARSDVQAALTDALSTGNNTLLLTLLDAWLSASKDSQSEPGLRCRLDANDDASDRTVGSANIGPAPENIPDKAPADEVVKFGRRVEDSLANSRSLKVDQAKIDRLMNLIGELVVSKNARPYLAERAESQFGVRELSREIKGQYSIINRIADEMQDAIMQVRMMAVSFIFQRFPRLVRDISRKLGKEVQLVLEGEQTEADKNIIESLADPLIHIIRNSLDHGLETPEVRLAAGKPATGKLIIRAIQQADRVVIEIIDDGKGIDPVAIKRKAYEKGIIDEAAIERISDQEAINLIFAAGLSTAEVVSDLSGRGVGMDVVRSAVEKINGTVLLESELGKGTAIRISLPLSMAVTQVMVIESDRQLFGVPMDHVVETMRIPRSVIHSIKQSPTAVLRGRIVPLKSLNSLLGIAAIPQANSDDELAVLLVQAGTIELGLLVDGFQETIGVIQKPLSGFLSNLSAFSGSALMGDGSVLMIINIREIV
jgi:two-component system chemotaxis sensor kinase CheA